MSNHKTFKAKRKPKYLVLTKCEPEEIDNISLKVRDLHTILSLMMDQTREYVSSIEEEHRRCGTAIDLDAAVGESTRKLENLIRILFAAFLSAYASLIYYVKESITPDGNSWLEKRRGSSEALSALDRLRNMEVHHEPLHTLIGMRYRVLGAGALFSSLESRETHAHLQLWHEGIGFYPPPLAKTAHFKSQPGLVEFVTYNSILELAHVAIHEVVSLIEDAVAHQFITAPTEEVKCTMLHASATKDAATSTANV